MPRVRRTHDPVVHRLLGQLPGLPDRALAVHPPPALVTVGYRACTSAPRGTQYPPSTRSRTTSAGGTPDAPRTTCRSRWASL
ncbi:protein of unknown function [Blastococcus saxobsidens DD2]|uniref:Uncharacterized protein n=1 Tax=Blastococcus saxobsidens (strain DD2) TaxID=1146883 RepID=H6RMH0_BLASD|nr:protein of unknown function [Blastococcus saxobsidens DD2]